MTKKEEKKRKSEDVCREILHGANEEMAMAGHDYINEDGYQERLERTAWYLDQEITGLDTEDELLLMSQDAESMLEEALDMNELSTVIMMAEISMSDVIENTPPHSLDHNQMREIINFAEELKTYLPRRG